MDSAKAALLLHRDSSIWSISMMRYNLEETAVYGKYVRWCGTGPRGPSYPIQQQLPYRRGPASRKRSLGIPDR